MCVARSRRTAPAGATEFGQWRLWLPIGRGLPPSGARLALHPHQWLMPSTYTNLLYHVIFSTKERRPFITSELRERLHPYIGGIIRDAGGEPIEIGGVADHVHILAELPSTLAVADALRLIKSNSSKWAG